MPLAPVQGNRRIVAAVLNGREQQREVGARGSIGEKVLRVYKLQLGHLFPQVAAQTVFVGVGAGMIVKSHQVILQFLQMDPGQGVTAHREGSWSKKT